jgi:hypothetical protein
MIGQLVRGTGEWEPITLYVAVPSLVLRLLAFLSASFLGVFTLGWAEPPVLPATELTVPPVIDGTIRDEEWAGANTLSGIVDSDTGAAYDKNTSQFWIAYDRRFIYIAARNRDEQPNKVTAVQYRTNVGLRGEDTVQLDIDPTGSLSEFNEFVLNANGASTISLAGGRAAKREWTGEIVSKGRITADGWEAEARIPWGLMKLPAAGIRDVRFNFARRIPRFNRTFAAVFIASGKGTDTPIWKGVKIPPSVVDRSIKLLPYTYTGYDKEERSIINSGLDLKTNLTDQVQLVGSVNPDFRNIEKGILSLDFSRFERLTDESRPFFLEGGDYIGSSLFASQRIESFDFGVNTYGRLNDRTNFGFLNAVDFNALEGDQRGTRNSTVATVTNQVDPHTSVRAAVTSLTAPGIENNAYLVRYGKDFGPWNLTLRDLGSDDKSDGFGRQSNYELNYSGLNWGVNTNYFAVAKNFNPRLGFFPEQDYKGFETNTFWSKDFDRGPFNSYGFYTGGNKFERSDNSPYRRGVYGGTFMTFRNNLAVTTGADIGQFEGTNDHVYRVNVNYPRGNPYRSVYTGYSWGDQAGASYDTFRVGGSYRTLKNLQLSGSYQVVRFGGYSDQLIIGGNFDLDADRSLAGRLVRKGQQINGYLSLRKSGNRGVEYFLILGDPNAERFRSSLILKVVIPTQFGRSS